MSITKNCLPREMTIFHKIGETDGVATYHKTYIKNVRLDEILAVNQNNTGEKTLETFRAFIDLKSSIATDGQNRQTYISSEIFQTLSSSEREGYWTVCEGDYVFPLILSAEDAAKSVTILKNKMRVFTVNSFSVQYDSHGIHHLEVSGRGKLLE